MDLSDNMRKNRRLGRIFHELSISVLKDLYAIVYIDTRYDAALKNNMFKLRAQLGEERRVHIWLRREHLHSVSIV